MNAWAPETLLIVSLAVAAIPIVIGIGTCYLKFSIVLSLLKSGFGTQQAPSGALVTALSTALSCIVMTPVFDATYARASNVKLAELGKANLSQIMTTARDISGPWREFLLRHAGDRELQAISAMATDEQSLGSNSSSDVPVFDREKLSLPIIIGAFVVSEVKEGFLMALFLMLPFFVIDLVVANILVGVGLTMMSPIIVALPIKILLFASADGWLRMVTSLIASYR